MRPVRSKVRYKKAPHTRRADVIKTAVMGADVLDMKTESAIKTAGPPAIMQIINGVQRRDGVTFVGARCRKLGL
jgi:hypothetical protein